MPGDAALEEAIVKGTTVLVVGPDVSLRLRALERLTGFVPADETAFLIDTHNQLRSVASTVQRSAPKVAVTEALREGMRAHPAVVIAVEPPEAAYPALFSVAEIGTQVLATLPGETAALGFARYLDLVVSAFALPRALLLRGFDSAPHLVVETGAEAPAGTVPSLRLWRPVRADDTVRLVAA